MERLKESQQNLTKVYKAYNEKVLKPLTELNVDDEVSLKKLLDAVMNRESISHMKNQKSTKESAELRGAIADVLLLHDNCDIKEIKAKMKKEAIEAAEEVSE